MSTPPNSQNHDHSYVYQELTKNDNGTYNLVNSIAYILYKKKKIDWYAQKNGSPTAEEKRQFHEIHMMPSTLESLRAQAAAIVQDVLNQTFDRKVEEIEQEFTLTNEAKLATELATLNQKIDTNHTLTTTSFGVADQLAKANHTTVTAKLNSMTEQGGKWWAVEIGKGTLITLASTLLLWLILVGIYQGKVLYDKADSSMNENAKGHTKTQPASEPKATQEVE